MRLICLLYLGVTVSSLAISQPKNRLSVGYQQGYIVERNDWSDLGLQVGLEHQLSPRWSVSASWAMEDYCRCDLASYFFHPRYRKWDLTFIPEQSSSSLSEPAFSRFFYWSLMGNYQWKLGDHPGYLLGSLGVTHRTGFEDYYLAFTWEFVFDVQWSQDWAIPIRLAYRYDPPHRWWGFTAFVLYQGYFQYESSIDLGNNPMNVMQAGISFDVRLGRKERLER
ncbi:MAG: hypothetical protein AAF399_10750 [Bacteroidota bacterium]